MRPHPRSASATPPRCLPSLPRAATPPPPPPRGLTRAARGAGQIPLADLARGAVRAWLPLYVPGTGVALRGGAQGDQPCQLRALIELHPPAAAAPAAPAAPAGAKGEAGVGLVLVVGGKGRYVVEALAPEGPASESGVVRPGDALVDVDGAPVAELALERVQALLRGGDGTPVTMTFERPPADPNSSRPQQARFPPPPPPARRAPGGLGWLRTTAAPPQVVVTVLRRKILAAAPRAAAPALAPAAPALAPAAPAPARADAAELRSRPQPNRTKLEVGRTKLEVGRDPLAQIKAEFAALVPRPPPPPRAPPVPRRRRESAPG
jgi:membrane-associated protease RseP (regulator of RpoE activity)